jgi:hypothetical protein
MKKVLLALGPSGVALIYVVAQLIAYSVSGHMYFSPSFVWEPIIYFLFAVLYISIAFYLDRSVYLRPAILGLVFGVIIFIIASTELFFSLEFFQGLSI